MHSIGKKVRVIGNKTKTGKMQHANCPCVINRAANYIVKPNKPNKKKTKQT